MNGEPRSRRSFDRFRFRRRHGLVVAPDLSDGDAGRVAGAINALLAERDRTTQRSMAGLVVDAYLGLNALGRTRFLRLLATRFGTDRARVDSAIDAVRDARVGAPRIAAERRLRKAAMPRHAELLHLVTGLPNGVKLLVDLRAELLAIRGSDPFLGLLDDELAGHLTTLFDVGLLELRRITWEQAPAAILEKLIAYEAVHEIEGFADLRHRLEADRRCYAFFHPAMPGEPIVFVEIALTVGTASALAPLLDQDGPVIAADDADTAIFYSITNCQPGLAGVALGNELIKRVVEALRRDLPELRSFVTLSPAPGFRAWLEQRLHGDHLSAFERDELGGAPPLDDAFALEQARRAVLSLCARYVTTVDDGRALDPVGHFHLSNGASVERLNWLANPAPYGMAESLGVMVNYLYQPSRIAANCRAYLVDGTVAASNQVRSLVH